MYRDGVSKHRHVKSQTGQCGRAAGARCPDGYGAISDGPSGMESLVEQIVKVIFFLKILQQKTEHRVAVTVCAVVTSFTITQAPSAVVLSVNSLLKERLDSHWYHMTTITSFLVVIGKSLNFVVFCLSSSSFRRRLINTLRSKYGTRDEKRSHSINTTYTRCDSRDSRILSQKKSFQSI
uniref:G-protein coupled receptors family 1 profile domain-containing protein n=1 Tax=Caenorhabditis japonica TaxID=281687 RepID=A0A8R1IGZ9_CAEJA